MAIRRFRNVCINLSVSPHITYHLSLVCLHLYCAHSKRKVVQYSFFFLFFLMCTSLLCNEWLGKYLKQLGHGRTFLGILEAIWTASAWKCTRLRNFIQLLNENQQTSPSAWNCTHSLWNRTMNISLRESLSRKSCYQLFAHTLFNVKQRNSSFCVSTACGKGQMWFRIKSNETKLNSIRFLIFIHATEMSAASFSVFAAQILKPIQMQKRTTTDIHYCQSINVW